MPTKLVAWAAVTAALALAALPGIVASEEPAPLVPLPDAAFQDVAGPGSPGGAVAALDPAHRSASFIAADEPLVDLGSASSVAGIPTKRPSVKLAGSSPGRIWNTPRYTLSGYASWYDNGTTAMRLARGTVVVVCGDGGCVERIVNDYGPWKGFRPVRVVDLMPSDFAAVCGCPTWRGTAPVSVRVY